jgi:hypothetical protein
VPVKKKVCKKAGRFFDGVPDAWRDPFMQRTEGLRCAAAVRGMVILCL